eukprot:GILI01023782.1.p1 GENE.GILI01023782.1~~GILI01023782.1.p1  ORF type:complete len:310 (-),score=47.69 GILI01023782.1:241-1170(-)
MSDDDSLPQTKKRRIEPAKEGGGSSCSTSGIATLLLNQNTPMSALWEALEHENTVDDIIAFVLDPRCGLECRSSVNDIIDCDLELPEDEPFETTSRLEPYLNRGCTPLMFAIYAGHNNAIKALLAAGADPDAKDTDSNRAPLHIAAMMGYKQAIELLLHYGATVDIHQKDEQTPLHYAASFGHAHCIDALINPSTSEGHLRADINATNKYGYSPLYSASFGGNDACVKRLLAEGADVNEADSDGCTILSATHSALSCLEMIIINGADVDAANVFGYTPLYGATTNRETTFAQLLMANGATVLQHAPSTC